MRISCGRSFFRTQRTIEMQRIKVKQRARPPSSAEEFSSIVPPQVWTGSAGKPQPDPPSNPDEPYFTAMLHDGVSPLRPPQAIRPGGSQPVLVTLLRIPTTATHPTAGLYQYDGISRPGSCVRWVGDPSGWGHLVYLREDETIPEPNEETSHDGDEGGDLPEVECGGSEAKRAGDDASADIVLEFKNTRLRGAVQSECRLCNAHMGEGMRQSRLRNLKKPDFVRSVSGMPDEVLVW